METIDKPKIRLSDLRYYTSLPRDPLSPIYRDAWRFCQVLEHVRSCGPIVEISDVFVRYERATQIFRKPWVSDTDDKYDQYPNRERIAA